MQTNQTSDLAKFFWVVSPWKVVEVTYCDMFQDVAILAHEGGDAFSIVKSSTKQYLGCCTSYRDASAVADRAILGLN